MKLPKVAIIILNWNGKQDTLSCLQSLEHLTYKNCEIILVDNGSTDGSVESIRKQYPSIILVQNLENLGFAEGNNRGMLEALKRGADYLLILNNDTTVTPQLIEPLLETATVYPQGAIIGGKILSMKNRELLDHLGGNWNPSKGVFDLMGLHEKASRYQTPLPLDYVCGCLLFFSKKVVETIGFFESAFFLFWEEADFCYRAKRANIPVLFTPKAVIEHKGSASFVGGKPHTEYYWWRNRFLWMERNCSRKSYFLHMITLFLPEFFHNSKMLLLKKIDLFLRPSLPSKKAEEKKNKIALYQIRVKAMSDYLLRKFGHGPDFSAR